MANITLTSEVRAVLERGRCEGNLFYLPEGQLAPKLYAAVNKILVMAGGKWKGGKARAHVFASDPAEKLGITLATGKIRDDKKHFQAFFTPHELADRMAELADVKGWGVLEPSAGHGSIAKACVRAGAGWVDCYDINSEYVDVLCRNGFDEAICGDFLKEIIAPYERIVMNPPFTKGQDFAHIKHAYSLLKTGGRLVSIASAGSSTEKKLIPWLEDVDGVWKELPEGTFKESGTNIRTLLITIDK